MKKKTLILLACCWSMVLASSTPICADEITFFGDFADKFGTVPVTYDSDTPYEPGAIIPLVSEVVVGIPMFDPTLGTLTDITVFVDPGSPIFYTLGGDMVVLEEDDSMPEYAASIGLFGDVSLNYISGFGFSPILTEGIPLGGGDVGAMGTGSFTTPVSAISDGELTGSSSVFGSVDLADFVGLGVVDKLFVELFVEDTADFVVDNSTATAGLGFDVFDSDSGIDDAVIGVTYTFTPVPEPSTIGILVGLGLPFVLRRKKR